MFFQILTGVFLSMHYISHSEYAFNSINLITREVFFGWAVRLMHIAGASGFFLFLVFHIGRGLYFASYKFHSVWLSGVTMLLISMAIGFLGYVLP